MRSNTTFSALRPSIVASWEQTGGEWLSEAAIMAQVQRQSCSEGWHLPYSSPAQSPPAWDLRPIDDARAPKVNTDFWHIGRRSELVPQACFGYGSDIYIPEVCK